MAVIHKTRTNNRINAKKTNEQNFTHWSFLLRRHAFPVFRDLGTNTYFPKSATFILRVPSSIIEYPLREIVLPSTCILLARSF